jgi:hypothetical protein
MSLVPYCSTRDPVAGTKAGAGRGPDSTTKGTP